MFANCKSKAKGILIVMIVVVCLFVMVSMLISLTNNKHNYDLKSDYFNDMAIVSIDSKQGVVDRKDHFIVKPGIYSYIDETEIDGNIDTYSYLAQQVLLDGYIVATHNNTCGLLDKNGKIIVPFSIDFDSVALINDEYAKVSKDNLSTGMTHHKYGVIRLSDGKLIVPVEYGCIMNFDPCLDFMAVKSSDTFLSSQEVVANGFSNDARIFSVDGDVIATYDYICYPQEDFATVYQEGKFGVVNERGELVIPISYSRIDCFNNGVAYYEMGNESGYIDKQGNIVNN